MCVNDEPHDIQIPHGFFPVSSQFDSFSKITIYFFLSIYVEIDRHNKTIPKKVEKFQETHLYLSSSKGMDLKVHENPEPIKDFDEKIEPEEMLDELWFFGNLLHCNNFRMFRSFSEPCTSSNHCSKEIFGEKSYEETYESIKKLTGNGESLRFNLVKAPSLPASMKERINESCAAKWGTDPGRSKSSRRILSTNLGRAPSLPTSLRTDEFQDEEVEFSMGKLIRQASMKNSDTMTHVKGVSPSSGIKRHQPRKKPERDIIKMESLEEIRTQPMMKQLRKQKSASIMGSKKMQDFGYDIKKKDILNHHKISIIPGLPEKHPLYLSEARGTHSSVPPVPKWGGNKSTEAMKEQIKFWARAVASNVHQEC
ncbi:uncharacterized protein LOC142519101 isoform X2 [Primulina tabacum]|uniref:uncharacterized protein LOC142519101 isoform X2 n=1 Tax=Primulina tabacum TaxID=48773 RepID=UPI003F5938E2